MHKEIEGLIVKEIPYSETSKIIHVYTNDGIIGIMCRGAKSLKSPFRATTLKFTYGKFIISYKENKLSNLINVDIINPLKNIKSDIVLLSYLNYVTELTTQVTKESDAIIYEDFINAILKIEEGLDPLIISNILEVKYLDYIGVGLNLDACIGCGSSTKIITLDGDRGGFICSNCYHNEPIVDAKTISLIRMYYYVEIKSISKLKISDTVKNEINTFLNIYYERYTGLYLKSKKFLDKLKD
ncbi:MAG: DNA repair protein RecO [Ruminococcus sp.]|nr:DNA repair protein RecO [Ruminococcus sp.]